MQIITQYISLHKIIHTRKYQSLIINSDSVVFWQITDFNLEIWVSLLPLFHIKPFGWATSTSSTSYGACCAEIREWSCYLVFKVLCSLKVYKSDVMSRYALVSHSSKLVQRATNYVQGDMTALAVSLSLKYWKKY